MNITSDNKSYGEISKEDLEKRIKIDSEILSNRLKATYERAEGWQSVSMETITPVNVIRPAHYGGEGNTYEVFNVLEAWDIDKDFYLGNVIKYVARAGKKDSSKIKEDLEKALVYLQRRISTL
jgi:hypothetical protein